MKDMSLEKLKIDCQIIDTDDVRYVAHPVCRLSRS